MMIMGITNTDSAAQKIGLWGGGGFRRRDRREPEKESHA